MMPISHDANMHVFLYYKKITFENTIFVALEEFEWHDLLLNSDK